MRALVTGATGFVGSHVVEALLTEGHQPVAAVRATSDTRLLERLGVPLVYCDVTDPRSLRAACDDIDGVIHTAAVVSGHGSWEPYRRIGVEGTKNVIDAAVRAGVPRFVHVGSIAVYGFGHEPGVTFREEMPCDEHPEPWNHYVREKVLSEKIVWRAHEAGHIAVTSLRPSVILGVRDRAVLPRMARRVRLPVSGLVGWGSNRVACIVVEDLARLAVMAATNERAIGRAYNASGHRVITQRELADAFRQAFGVGPRPLRAPLSLAMGTAAWLERFHNVVGIEEEPLISRFLLMILGQDYLVDSTRAEQELGWRANADYEEAIRSAVAASLDQQARSGNA
jgi:nucleoside-diphosphate-sugar epimerase